MNGFVHHVDASALLAWADSARREHEQQYDARGGDAWLPLVHTPTLPGVEFPMEAANIMTVGPVTAFGVVDGRVSIGWGSFTDNTGATWHRWVEPDGSWIAVCAPRGILVFCGSPHLLHLVWPRRLTLYSSVFVGDVANVEFWSNGSRRMPWESRQLTLEPNAYTGV